MILFAVDMQAPCT